MSQFPNSLASRTEPLTIAMVSPADGAVIEDLAAKGYEVHTQLTEEYANEIISMCRQPSIKEYCPNDYGRRFKDLASTKEWLKKGRCSFLLLKKEEDGTLRLTGYGWAGDETSSHVPGGETTLAIRIGEAGQGQGLATPFFKLITAGTAKLYGSKNIWVETWASNGGAVHVYHKVGFEDVDQLAGERPTPAGRMVDDKRLYMSIPNGRLNT